MDKIQIRGIRCPLQIGISEEERRHPQELRIDVTLWLKLDLPGHSDDLTDTVDYKTLADQLRASAQQSRPALLESLATRLCREVLQDERVQRVRVRIRKWPESMLGLVDWVAVERTLTSG